MNIDIIKSEIFYQQRWRSGYHIANNVRKLYKQGVSAALLSLAKWEILSEHNIDDRTDRCGFCFQREDINRKLHCTGCPVQNIFGHNCSKIDEYLPSKVLSMLKPIIENEMYKNQTI